MEFYDITPTPKNNNNIPIESTKFAIVQDTNIRKGIFYVFRWFWFLTVNGRRWQIISTTMILTLLGLPFALAVDVIILILYHIVWKFLKKLFGNFWHNAKEILKTIWTLFLDLIRAFFDKAIFPTLKLILKIIAIVIIAIILIFKFDYIKNLVFNLFEYFT